MVQAGRLKHTVVVERQSTSEDVYGEKVDVWTPVATRRAAIEPINGKEYFSKSGEHAEVTARIRMRYDTALANLAPMDRVRDGTVVYDIQSVINPVEGNRDLILMVKRAYPV